MDKIPNFSRKLIITEKIGLANPFFVRNYVYLLHRHEKGQHLAFAFAKALTQIGGAFMDQSTLTVIYELMKASSLSQMQSQCERALN